MKNKLIVVILIIAVVVIVISLLASRWHSSLSPKWMRYIPEIRICHLGDIPPAGGSHCHWIWETPHSHPQ